MNTKKIAITLLSLLLCGALLTDCALGSKLEATAQTAASLTAVKETAENDTVDYELPDGVVPITWEPSANHLIIETDEARELYTKIKAGDYPDIETLKNSNVVAQIDALSAYYIKKYGNTIDINTPEREQLREDVLKEFLTIGSARIAATDMQTGRNTIVYDGPLKKEYKLEIVLGLPASGKSTRVTDPDSAENKAFILDCDVIKELLPEFKESHGGAADAVHMESMLIMNNAIVAFTTGDMRGTNVIIPIVASDYDDLVDNYIKPFEEAGYNVHVKFVECEEKVSMARNVARELETGRIINSAVVFSFGTKPQEVYERLAPELNSFGEPFDATYEQEEDAA